MATKYFMTGSSSNWSDDTNWSTTASSGPNNTTHAVAGDAVLLDAGSPACIIDTASATASIVCTGYTNTLTLNADLTCTSTVTFVAGMTIAGTAGTLICNAGGGTTLTSGGKVLTGGLTLKTSGNFTYTLSGAWACNGLLTYDVTNVMTFSGGSVSSAGGITFGGVGASLQAIGTTTTLTGGTWSFSGGGNWNGPLVLAGNITVSGTVGCPTTLTYSSGTITTTGSSLSIIASATVSTSAVTWDTVLSSAASGKTVTLSNNLNAATLTINGVGGCEFAGAGVANFTDATIGGGGLVCTTTVNVSGTTTISANLTGAAGLNSASLVLNSGTGINSTLTLNGTGTWSGSGAVNTNTGLVKINCPGNTLTITYTGNFIGALTYVAGTVVTTGNTFTLGNGTCTLDTAGMVWDNITKGLGTNTVILNSLLTVAGTLTLNDGDVTWAGSAGFTTAALTHTALTATHTYTFKHGNTYTITGAMTIGTDGQTLNMTSDDATVRALMPLDPAATQLVKLVSATRIDSSGGQTIVDYGGTLDDTINWILGSPPNIGFAR